MKQHPTSNRRPNVVVILADDMGYGDLSAYGSQLVETTHIDSIGRDGVRFTDGYSSAPLCSPSRAGPLKPNTRAASSRAAWGRLAQSPTRYKGTSIGGDGTNGR